jgi:hypothetical protein
VTVINRDLERDLCALYKETGKLVSIQQKFVTQAQTCEMGQFHNINCDTTVFHQISDHGFNFPDTGSMRSMRSMRGSLFPVVEGPCKRYAMARHVCQATTASRGRSRSLG